MKKFTAAVCSFLFLSVGATVYADTIGYEFNIGGLANVPTLSLENLSTSLDITAFSITIGDTAYNWDLIDSITDADSTGYTLETPDYKTNGGIRSDEIRFSFSSFKAGDFFEFTADVDIDNSNTGEYYYDVLFNNGDAANSLVSVTFSDGRVLSDYLTDGSGGPRELIQTFDGSAVPEPATMVLFGFGLLGLAGVCRKKRDA